MRADLLMTLRRQLNKFVYRQFSRLAPYAVACAYGSLAWAGVVLTAGTERISAIWLSNGLLLGFLLSSKRAHAPLTFAAALIANVVANFLIGDPPAQALLVACCNSAEVAVAYSILHGRLRRPDELFATPVLISFLQSAVLAAPIISGLAAASVLSIFGGYDFVQTLVRWTSAHALGMAIVVPLFIALRSSGRPAAAGNDTSSGDIIAFVVLVLVACATFAQDRVPIIFVLFPPLLAMIFRRGFPGAAVGIATIAAIAIGFTTTGHGPLMLMLDASVATKILYVQVLLAVLVLTSYPICAMLVRNQELLATLASREQKLRVIAENSRDIVIHTDRHGIRRYVSPAVQDVLGYTPEEATGRGGSALIHPDDQLVFEREEARLAAGAPETTLTYRVRHRLGHFVWIEVTARVMRDANGQVHGWISTSRDISERKRAEQMKDDFVATVSHELRTPLTALVGAIGMAASGKVGALSPALTRLLELARSNGQRLALLIDDILDFEKLSSGSMQFEMRNERLRSMLESAVAMNKPYADRLNVSLRIGSVCESEIYVDAHRFQQVLSNLLSNAAKFSPAGGSVEIEARSAESKCTVTVTDHGGGIPAEFRSSLFTRFAQADSSDGRKRGGTGLGLAIAKDMTERMNGRIYFESEEGTGTKFYLVFPTVSAQSVEAA